MLYYMYIIFLNIQYGIIVPIHRIGDGAHAAGIADHGSVGGGTSTAAVRLRWPKAQITLWPDTSKKAPLKKI